MEVVRRMAEKSMGCQVEFEKWRGRSVVCSEERKKRRRRRRGEGVGLGLEHSRKKRKRKRRGRRGMGRALEVERK